MSVPLQLPPETWDTLAFVLVVGAVIAFLGGVVYLEHRKEMALIEAGAYDDVTGSDDWILGAGLVLLAVGGAAVANAVLRGSVPGVGLALALLGVAALVYYYLKRRGASDATPDAGEST